MGRSDDDRLIEGDTIAIVILLQMMVMNESDDALSKCIAFYSQRFSQLPFLPERYKRMTNIKVGK